jgi:hypothetical protein
MISPEARAVRVNPIRRFDHLSRNPNNGVKWGIGPLKSALAVMTLWPYGRRVGNAYAKTGSERL